MNKEVFQILWTKFDYFYEVFLIFSQPAVYFEKSPSQMKIDEEHLFLRNSSWGALLITSNVLHPYDFAGITEVVFYRKRYL